MNYKQNLHYFKDGDGIKILGMTLTIAGGLVFYFGWSYISYVLSCIAIPAGLVLFFWSTGRRSSDKDIEDAVAERIKGIGVDWESDKRLSTRRRKGFEPMIVQGYEYDEGLLLKKAKDGSLRSTRYAVAELSVLENALYLSTREFSLIEDVCEEQAIEIPFSDLREISLAEEEKRLPYGKTAVRVTDYRLNVQCMNGKILSFPVSNDLSVELFVERLQTILTKGTQSS